MPPGARGGFPAINRGFAGLHTVNLQEPNKEMLAHSICRFPAATIRHRALSVYIFDKQEGGFKFVWSVVILMTAAFGC